MKRAFIILLFTVALFMFTACSLKTESTATANVPNPVTEYKSVEEINRAADFDVLMLPEDLGYIAVKLNLIDRNIAEVEYIRDGDDGVDIWTRQAKGKSDISGIYGVDYQEEQFNSLTVNKGRYENTDDNTLIMVAWFTDADYSYSLNATGINSASFDEIIRTMTTRSK